ncbi:MAG: NAD(P)H-binding protein [Anaerolineae bacterium]
MNKPRILVMTAAGKTGMPIALQLLREGFPVTAFVRQNDSRSESLRARGADIVVGSLTDINDMRRAMKGVQRAYFCTPFSESNLKTASVFVAVVAEHPLESVTVMSQWLANPNHPSVHTREVWLSDQLLSLLPGTTVTFINPGFFADNDLQTLPFVAQVGLLPVPYGEGLNAPPSNEDIARVAAEILARPDGHAGKRYRPTGPTLLSPYDLAAIFSKVFGHNVRYINMPGWVFAKVAKGMGQSDYTIAQYLQYVLDYQHNAFAVNAPTDVIQEITGRAPEDFETIVRRYVANNPNSTRRFTKQLELLLMMNIWMLLPGPKLTAHLRKQEFSEQAHIALSSYSSAWLNSHQPQTS